MCAVRNGSVRNTSSCLSESHSQLDPYLFFSTFSIFVGGEKKKFPFWMRRIFFVDSLCRHSFIDFFHWISSSSIYIRQLNKISRNRMPKKEKKCRKMVGRALLRAPPGDPSEWTERPRRDRDRHANSNSWMNLIELDRPFVFLGPDTICKRLRYARIRELQRIFWIFGPSDWGQWFLIAR